MDRPTADLQLPASGIEIEIEISQIESLAGERGQSGRRYCAKT